MPDTKERQVGDPAQTTQTAVRLPYEVRERIRRDAEAETRTLSGQIIHLLRWALAQRDREQARTDVR